MPFFYPPHHVGRAIEGHKPFFFAFQKIDVVGFKHKLLQRGYVLPYRHIYDQPGIIKNVDTGSVTGIVFSAPDKPRAAFSNGVYQIEIIDKISHPYGIQRKFWPGDIELSEMHGFSLTYGASLYYVG